MKQHWIDFSDQPPIAFERELVKQFPALTAAASRAGVHLLAGTDLGDPYVMPGYALQDELTLMVQAGVSPLTALQSATSEPAEAFGLSSTLGSLRVGFTADLIVLDADPLIDIQNLRTINSIVLNGRWIPKETLGLSTTGR